jgi:hypothetical protein
MSKELSSSWQHRSFTSSFLMCKMCDEKILCDFLIFHATKKMNEMKEMGNRDSTTRLVVKVHKVHKINYIMFNMRRSKYLFYYYYSPRSLNFSMSENTIYTKKQQKTKLFFLCVEFQAMLVFHEFFHCIHN